MEINGKLILMQKDFEDLCYTTFLYWEPVIFLTEVSVILNPFPLKALLPLITAAADSTVNPQFGRGM